MSKGLNLRDLLEIRLKKYSERIIKSVKNNTMLFFIYFEKQHNIITLDKLSHVHIKSYIKYKQSLGLKATYINSILKNMSMFFAYLVEQDYIETNICKRIKFQKEEKVIIKTFTDKEVSRMIDIYTYETYLNARNKCIVALLMDTLIEIVGAIIDFIIGIIGSGLDRYFKRKNSEHKKGRTSNK